MELPPRSGEKEANFSADLQIRLFRRREAAEESEAEEGGGEGEIGGGFGVGIRPQRRVEIVQFQSSYSGCVSSSSC